MDTFAGFAIDVVRRRPLTIATIAGLRDRLGISADILIGPWRRAA